MFATGGNGLVWKFDLPYRAVDAKKSIEIVSEK